MTTRLIPQFLALRRVVTKHAGPALHTPQLHTALAIRAGCRHDTVDTEEHEREGPTAGDHSNGMGRAAGLWLPCLVAKLRGAEPPDDVRGGPLHGLCPSSSQWPASVCFRCIRAQGWTPLLCASLNLTLMKDSYVPFCEVEPHPQFPDAWNP